VVLELAVNGITTKDRNPNVPRTPAEITEAMLAGIAHGAAIVHNHNDEPMWVGDGVHAVQPYLDAWRPILAAHPRVLGHVLSSPGVKALTVIPSRYDEETR
jgi:3-keto-5-aminohexanoate cleavage enzyme